MVFLRRAEVKKPQRNAARAVRDDHGEHGAPAAHDGRMLDLAFNQHLGTRVECADGVEAGAVLVTIGQVKQQILGGVDTQLVQG